MTSGVPRHLSTVYFVIYDPCPEHEGGYRKGARFYGDQVTLMLQGPYRGFTPGTILRHNGITYVVKNLGGGSNALVLVQQEVQECLSQTVTTTTGQLYE